MSRGFQYRSVGQAEKVPQREKEKRTHTPFQFKSPVNVKRNGNISGHEEIFNDMTLWTEPLNGDAGRVVQRDG